jgi:hypothetical protein
MSADEKARLEAAVAAAEADIKRLRAENAELATRLSRAAAAGRIENLASKRLGLVPAQPDQTTYVRLRPDR